jgi:hypothetical protein
MGLQNPRDCWCYKHFIPTGFSLLANRPHLANAVFRFLHNALNNSSLTLCCPKLSRRVCSQFRTHAYDNPFLALSQRSRKSFRAMRAQTFWAYRPSLLKEKVVSRGASPRPCTRISSARLAHSFVFFAKLLFQHTYLSISPSTISSVPIIATTSATR